jgi:hypothetical protein
MDIGLPPTHAPAAAAAHPAPDSVHIVENNIIQVNHEVLYDTDFFS